MNEKIQNRSEIVFLYDVTDANPNGDPLDENKPRMDEEENINIVTDVRLKRTARDYLDSKGEKIFIKEEEREDCTQKSRARRLAEFLAENPNISEEWGISPEDVENKEDSTLKNKLKEINYKDIDKALLETYIDLRLFGSMIAVENSTITNIGPVQFNFGRSLHEVSPNFTKGSTVMPSQEGAEQGTLTEMWNLPYSLIAFHGVVNENAAEETNLTRKDVDKLLEGLWVGTKNLLTRSKKGHSPKMLLEIEYDEDNYHIGGLRKKIGIKTEKDEVKIRSTEEYKLDLKELIESLKKNKEKIEKIRYKISEDLNIENNMDDDLVKEMGKIAELEEINF